MFTGIIQAIGRIERLDPKGVDFRILVEATADFGMANVQIGDSIAVNGVCLTVTTKGERGFAADVSRETLDVTTLGKLTSGSRVNLEQALTLNTHLGGHLVSGHVDGIGHLVGRYPDGRSLRMQFEFPAELARYIAPKGSICVDGVSLTVNSVTNKHFELNIVPHTLAGTIIDQYREGCKVNLEVDLIARYLERLLQSGQGSTTNHNSKINEAFLAQHGF